MKILQVGFGRWGARHHKAWKSLGCEVFIAEVGDDPLRIALQNNVDLVDIVCSSVNHFTVASNIAPTCLPIFCEKPVFVSPLDLARFESLFMEHMTSPFFASGHQLLYHPDVQKLKEMGQPKFMSSVRTQAIPRDEGAVLSLAVHDIAIFLYLMDWAMPNDIRATGSKFDAYATLTWPNTTATLHVSAFAKTRARTLTVVPAGTEPPVSIHSGLWDQHNLLELQFSQFKSCLEGGFAPVLNTPEQTIKIMKIAFTINKLVEVA